MCSCGLSREDPRPLCVPLRVLPAALRCTSLQGVRTRVRACVRHCESSGVCVRVRPSYVRLFEEAVNEARVHNKASFLPKQVCSVLVPMLADVCAIKPRPQSSLSEHNRLC